MMSTTHTIISRKMIKPSSPTPYYLRTYNLSEIDQRIAHVYMPLVLYYPNHEICSLTPDDKVRVIKMSLSQSLTRYYPFAGRLHTPTASYIDCNDEGVVFVEARIDSQLNMHQQISDCQLFADGMVWENSHECANLVAVQLTHFACGGTAVAVSMSHRIGDACTLDSFVSHWASVARYGFTDHKEVLPLDPHFIQSPATTNFLAHETSVLKPWRCVNPVTRKFVFPNSKLQDLKNKVIALVEGESSTLFINKPTRVEVLTSLIYKTVVAATNQGSSSFKPSILVVPVNIRNKVVPKLPQTTVGNLIADMLVTTRHESEASLCLVVSKIKKQKMELERVQSPQLARQKTDLILSRLEKEDLENMAKRSFWCSSLCLCGFYKADFGWGNPSLVSTTYRSSNHMGSVLMDTPNGDGIEAWVTLETQDMERFQNDMDLLSFAKIN